MTIAMDGRSVATKVAKEAVATEGRNEAWRRRVAMGGWSQRWVAMMPGDGSRNGGPRRRLGLATEVTGGRLQRGSRLSRRRRSRWRLSWELGD